MSVECMNVWGRRGLRFLETHFESFEIFIFKISPCLWHRGIQLEKIQLCAQLQVATAISVHKLNYSQTICGVSDNTNKQNKENKPSIYSGLQKELQCVPGHAVITVQDLYKDIFVSVYISISIKEYKFMAYIGLNYNECWGTTWLLVLCVIIYPC